MSTRIAVTILVLLLLPVVIGPIVIGVLLERGVEKIQAQARASSIEIEFDRGLYTSTARTRIALAGEPGDGGEALEFAMDHVFVHGPIPLAAPAISRSPLDLVIVLVRSRIEADPAVMPRVAEALEGDALLTLQTRVTSVGDVDVDVESPAFELDAGRLVWAGLSGTITVRDSGRVVEGELGTPGLHASDDQASLVLHEVELEFTADLQTSRLAAQLEQAGSEWVVGDRRFETGRITVEADQPMGGDLFGESHSSWKLARIFGRGGLGESDFDVTGIDVQQTVNLDAATGLHRVVVGLAFEAWRVGELPPDGPGAMTIVLDRIDRAAVERFRETLQKLEATGGSPEEVAAMRPFVALEQIPSVLASSPSFDVRDAHVTGPEGRLDASMRLAIDGSQPELLSDPFMLMSQIEARAGLRGPEPLVRRLLGRLVPPLESAPGDVPAIEPGAEATPMEPGAAVAPGDRIDAWIADGTLVRDGDQLVFDAAFEDGLPMLNGEPADASALMNLMPGL